MQGTRILTSALAVALALTLLPGAAPAAETPGSFVTGPAAGTPLEIALGYLDANRGELGLTAGDIADFAVSDEYTTQHNGVTHVYLQQRLGGIEVVNGLFNVNVMPDGR
ncbi:MAG: metalloprotease, partial [Acidobacteriota bacterium]|nr:metalloprotease [Acidobacteriota bacterium]